MTADVEMLGPTMDRYLTENKAAACISIKASIAMLRDRTGTILSDVDLEQFIGTIATTLGKAILFDHHGDKAFRLGAG
ncbi:MULTISPECIES: hypothetical protein [unclassified Mesorhizobium]|uniref:hypothetical protein n=1 Tax=unclassified Mesorhizobium TaxID=325217 RepID=UPI0012DC4AD1|nr:MULTISPECIES: hypothetical protein [unclassified Mesorhizobium]